MLIRKLVIPLSVLVSAASSCFAADLPDPKLTPGATVDVPLDVMCKPGYSKTQRHTSQKLKEEVYAEYGIKTHKAGEYEIDHLISLELGGADVKDNLWPQSYITQPLNAHRKDTLENALHALVCSNKIPLKEAQKEIKENWVKAYQKYQANKVGNKGKVTEIVE